MTNQRIKPKFISLEGIGGALYLRESYDLSSFSSKCKSVFINLNGLAK